jgi:hypothetical protein
MLEDVITPCILHMLLLNDLDRAYLIRKKSVMVNVKWRLICKMAALKLPCVFNDLFKHELKKDFCITIHDTIFTNKCTAF